MLFVTEPLGAVNTRHERLSAIKQTLEQHPECLMAQAEVPLNDGQALDSILSDFHQQHASKRCAVVVVNGALTLQVARSLKRLDLHWGRDLGLLGFDELNWSELAGVGITTLKQPTRRLVMPRWSRCCAALKATPRRRKIPFILASLSFAPLPAIPASLFPPFSEHP